MSMSHAILFNIRCTTGPQGNIRNIPGRVVTAGRTELQEDVTSRNLGKRKLFGMNSRKEGAL
jgi:hypothetical protein